MILDCNGKPLRRVAGFITRYEPLRKVLPLLDAVSVVGFEAPAEASDEDEEDAARVAIPNAACPLTGLLFGRGLRLGRGLRGRLRGGLAR